LKGFRSSRELWWMNREQVIDRTASIQRALTLYYKLISKCNKAYDIYIVWLVSVFKNTYDFPITIVG